MIPKKSLDSVLDQSIILTKTAPNDNAKSISVQCAPPWIQKAIYTSTEKFKEFEQLWFQNHAFQSKDYFLLCKLIKVKKRGLLEKKYTCRGYSIISKFSSKQSCQLGQGETPGFWYNEKYEANATYQYHTVSTEKVGKANGP